MLMMLEETLRTTSKLMVVIASRYPAQLRAIKMITDKHESLLKRAIEDHLHELAVKALKKHMLDSHINFNNFTQSEE